MNERQRDFVTAIIKIVFTVIFGGMAGGKLFDLSLNGWHYFLGLMTLALLFLLGFIIQRENQ